jgi:hypothetical protein
MAIGFAVCGFAVFSVLIAGNYKYDVGLYTNGMVTDFMEIAQLVQQLKFVHTDTRRG